MTKEELEAAIVVSGERLRTQIGANVVIIVTSLPGRGTTISGNGDRRLLRALEKAIEKFAARQEQ